MSRIAYVNGRYLRYGEARVPIDDRGYQFGDGIYEVCEIRDGALIDESRHLARLERSLAALRIKSADLACRAALHHARGRRAQPRARRHRLCPGDARHRPPRSRLSRSADPPGLVVTARAIDRRLGEARAAEGVRVISAPDLRWARPDIKSLQLLPNVLAKQAARDRGAYEAWLVDAQGQVTEGASTNAWIVTRGGRAGHAPGGSGDSARRHAHDLARRCSPPKGWSFEERAFSLEEAYGAREAFLTSAVNIVMPVVAIDDRSIGDGRPGPLALSLRGKFHDFAEASRS